MNMQETIYLFRSPKNARHLMESISQLRGGKARVREFLGEKKAAHSKNGPLFKK